METANHSLEMEKRQITIPSSSERDEGTFPKDTPRSESPACKGETIADQPPFWVWVLKGRDTNGYTKTSDREGRGNNKP